MKLSQIRTELVAEHVALRQMALEIDAEAQRVLAQEGSLDALRVSLVRFAERLAAHNLHEEALLRDELPTIDAWGPQREALMNENHEKEHATVLRSISEAVSAGAPGEIAQHVRDLMRRVLEHMKSEEKEILHPDLLRDDVVSIQGMSG